LRKPPEKVDVGICLDGVANQVRYRLERFVEYAYVPLQRLLTVNVNGSSDFLRNLAERNAFTVKFAFLILEVVHEPL
jgi:hypothetical protein